MSSWAAVDRLERKLVLLVDCGWCGMGAGWPCRTKNGDLAQRPHNVRYLVSGVDEHRRLVMKLVHKHYRPSQGKMGQR